MEAVELLNMIRLQGVEETYSRSLEKIYRSGIAIIKTEKVPIRKNVRQGDTLSLKLFMGCLQEMFTKLNCCKKGTKVGWYLRYLRFVDGVAVLSKQVEN